MVYVLGQVQNNQSKRLVNVNKDSHAGKKRIRHECMPKLYMVQNDMSCYHLPPKNILLLCTIVQFYQTRIHYPSSTVDKAITCMEDDRTYSQISSFSKPCRVPPPLVSFSSSSFPENPHLNFSLHCNIQQYQPFPAPSPDKLCDSERHKQQYRPRLMPHQALKLSIP